MTGDCEKEEKTEDVPAKQDPSSKQVSVRVHVRAHVCVCVCLCSPLSSFVTCDCDVSRAFLRE